MTKNIFLTTTLPYVNSVPHIGHSFEFILGDAISRYLKLNGYNVFFNVGLDEHGRKVWEKANENGITPQEHIQILTDKWLNFCRDFEIGFDNFYKTSTIEHHEKVKIVWNRFLERGDIYKKLYTGNYCLGCESYKADKDLVNGVCPDHPNSKLEYVEEENYHFRLTKYKDILLNWIENTPSFLLPESKIDELKNIILSSEDISISRSVDKCPWGVEVPNDSEHVIYVWFDALLNYIFAAGYLTDKFSWEHVIQICGPDNLRFQAVIFQAFLESEGIKKSNKLIVHGTVLDAKGKKMSKSEGNTVDPVEQLSKYGLNPVRYYSLYGLNTYTNSSWNEVDLVNLYNANICNDWGNLLSRVLHLVDTKCNGEVVLPDNDLQIETILNDIDIAWNNFQIKDALHQTNLLVKHVNKYLNDKEPWKLENPVQIISNVYSTLNIINDKYYPVFPSKYLEVKRAILNKKKEILFTKLVIPK